MSEPTRPIRSGKFLLIASHDEATLLAGECKELPVDLVRVTDGLHAVQALRGAPFHAVVVRLPLTDWQPEELLEEIQRARHAVPVLFVDRAEQGALDWAAAIRLVKLGAFHYMRWDSGPALDAAVRSAINHYDLVSASYGLHAETWRQTLIGASPGMENVIQTIRLIGSRRSTVLITGETGTGKEMVARAIHAASSRSGEMVAVNCSALPENLLEAELFGHVKGAFTGAIQHRVGRFEQARSGTLFLDEIADMPLELQAKLLRVLQEREFQRLGSSETVKTDARVVAASNVDLGERVRQGRFREDLFYRINVVPIRVPALRERPGDIPLLARHFVARLCEQEGVAARHIATETLDRLRQYHWPGNVRQLENAIEMAVALSGDRETLYPGDFPLPQVLHKPQTLAAMAPHIPVPEEGLNFDRLIGTIEMSLLEQALARTGGNKKLAADLLGLKRTTLAAKLKSLEATAAPSPAH